MTTADYWYRCRTDEDDEVIAEVRAACLADGLVIVGDVWTHSAYRWRGLAGDLLDELCARADREDWRLYLCPAAGGGERSLSQRGLVAFYGRRGFRPLATGDMIRYPEVNTKEAVA